MTEQFPTYSYVRISGQLRLIGVGVSPSAVRAVWQRHGLTLRIHRLLWLEQKTAERGGLLTERQIRLLQLHRRRTVDPEQHVEAPYPSPASRFHWTLICDKECQYVQHETCGFRARARSPEGD